MKTFIAKCVSFPVLDYGLSGFEDVDGYTIGRFYEFVELDKPSTDTLTLRTWGDDNVQHTMDADYFSKYFTRVFTDKDGYCVER